VFEQCSVEESINQLKSDGEAGLSPKEARKRLGLYGKNEMKESRKKTAVETFLEQLNDPLIYVLIVAAGISVFLKEVNDAVIIGVVVLVNAIVGMIQEGKAQKALDALKKMTSPKATVIRDGRKQEIAASLLVPGDLVCLEAGCLVPADLRLTECVNLRVEESALTGESNPIEKDADFKATGGKELPLGDRKNMAYMTTLVSGGRGKGIVTHTGMHTEIGKIAGMISQGKEEMTPLQKRLGELGKVLSVLSLGLCVALFAVAILQKRNLMEMLLTAISLAVAAVPEGLPAVVTICLALSVTRMVRVNTIVRKLPSVETLGSVSVVCSDKTGTLTQNRMRVEQCFLDGSVMTPEQLGQRGAGGRYQEFFQGLLLCNDASIEEGRRLGDPTELALIDFGEALGYGKKELERRMPRTGELPFDSDRKMMSTLHNGTAYTKGAPDEVLKRCTHIKLQSGIVPLTEQHRRQIRERMKKMAALALRTLGVAMKQGVNAPKEEGLTFLGMVGMQDPARPEAGEAVLTFREAGVDTVMITGDHVDTAYAIAKQLHIVGQPEQCMSGETLEGLSDEEFLKSLDHTRVFARVSPSQKVRIVKGFQKKKQIVAMTGDGVNDAPSLQTADIGIAMGKCGTDVAKQAADMILTDDNFATIERAIEEGRGVYENIRKSVIFLLSSNLGEIMTMFVAVLCGLSSPLKSSHILWINLITDSLPALALGIDKNDGKSLMKYPPRKGGESLFARGGLACTCFYGGLIAAISLVAFLMLPWILLKGMGVPITLDSLADVLGEEGVLIKAQTYAFTVLGMSQLFHAMGMRDVHRSVFSMGVMKNKLMLFACGVGFLLQFAVTEVPFLIQAFGTSPLSGLEWAILAGLAAFPLLAHEVIALFR